ncbi:MAG: peptidylprolyl isomerase [Rhodobacteraceae bacterium]|nr:peptidylprolyl isomerase [Paracoccaceae bacterium]
MGTDVDSFNNSLFRNAAHGLALCASLLLAPFGAAAQGLFSPAITIDGQVITNYELDQRVKLLTLFRSPGSLEELAREQLIEDRLKASALNRQGLSLTDEGLATAMNDFASRTNMPLEQFVALLAQNDIGEETLRDFVRSGVTWRDYVRLRFGDRVTISEADIDQALSRLGTATSGIEVLLTEIIIAAPPPQAASAMATARRIAELTSFSAFEAQARRHSALPSKTNGGRLGWLPISNYPAGLRSLLLALAPGEVTAPIPITNGVALFQMRDIREVAVAAPEPALIEYAALYLGAGTGGAGQRLAAQIAGRIDTCDDLYGEAIDMAPEQLERSSVTPAEIPDDVAMELAKLDPSEVSTALTRANGETVVLLMLCNRVAEGGEDVDRASIRNQLRSQQLGGYAASLLADLRAAATITFP